MEEREIAFIANDLYQRNLEGKKNGVWTQNDLEMEAKLYDDLNSLNIVPFKFYWHMQLSPLHFTSKDKAIVPIFVKYFRKFDSLGLNTYPIDCLGVPKLYEATPYLMEEYWNYRHISTLYHNSITNAIYRIRDSRYIDAYIKIIQDWGNLRVEDFLIIELLGKLKSQKALPALIELLDFISPVEGEKGDEITGAIITSAAEALLYYKNPEYLKLVARCLKKKGSYVNQNFLEAIARVVKKMGGKVEKIKEAPGKYKWIYIE